ncbi:hypothetical protein [Corynebacterium bovis]|uniref:hypothetical protein n=1 Tax=Corynebacterium bovis TaxID=36808 RepID=UPI0021AB7B20|nr:hypothetical protein [Corynebacterium bovis]MDN8579896.1 hypothetical protein [Corynebacterium bovis]
MGFPSRSVTVVVCGTDAAEAMSRTLEFIISEPEFTAQPTAAAAGRTATAARIPAPTTAVSNVIQAGRCRRGAAVAPEVPGAVDGPVAPSAGVAVFTGSG